MKTLLCRFLFVALVLPQLTGCMAHQQPGSTAGAAMGGIAGVILDQRNPWRGGIIGATLGAIAGATIADISDQAAREAAYAQRPVEYRTDNHRAYYYAEPLGYDQERHCRKVREKVYVDGRLYKKRTIVICDQGQYERPNYRYERRYDRYEREDDDDD
ncbi:hypothetical protein [Geobacter argillaceus]|uniref:Glycine zipper 2TM domain-containing protein n=1 Tax=Geobacter argillaceus TaxID=345631 RepID=A0A562VJT9_9BACT|nr:hypothetical protein [Geobacter argillaceus]TWJ18071.1 hypothetical protein JN12_02832 [Geobacter argillaceus]